VRLWPELRVAASSCQIGHAHCASGATAASVEPPDVLRLHRTIESLKRENDWFPAQSIKPLGRSKVRTGPRLMPNEDSERFRQEAEECRHQAEKAISQRDKEEWLRLAAEWLKLAQSAEHRKPSF
jgi:hypothetical protein